MSRIVWLDKNKKVIFNGDYLVNEKGEIFRVIGNRTILKLQAQDDSIVKINKDNCRTAFNSIDLKHYQRQVNYRVYE